MPNPFGAAFVDTTSLLSLFIVGPVPYIQLHNPQALIVRRYADEPLLIVFAGSGFPLECTGIKSEKAT